jgi:hypothetical protein
MNLSPPTRLGILPSSPCIAKFAETGQRALPDKPLVSHMAMAYKRPYTGQSKAKARDNT